MRDYPGESTDTVRTRQIAGIRARARLTDAAPWFLGIISAVTLLLGAGAVAGAWLSGEVPGRAARQPSLRLLSSTEAVQALGSWLVGLGFVAVRRLGPARLPGRLGPPHHRHPLGRRYLLAARRAPLRAALLRRARRARPDLADGHLDRRSPADGSSSPATPRAACWRPPRSGS